MVPLLYRDSRDGEPTERHTCQKQVCGHPALLTKSTGSISPLKSFFINSDAILLSKCLRL